MDQKLRYLTYKIIHLKKNFKWQKNVEKQKMENENKCKIHGKVWKKSQKMIWRK